MLDMAKVLRWYNIRRKMGIVRRTLILANS